MTEIPPAPRVIRWLAAAERLAIGGLMAAITLLTLVQVIWRYGLNQPINWSEEVARYCFVWVTLLGAAALLRLQDGHPELDALYVRSGNLMRKSIVIVSRIAILVCVLAISAGGFRMMYLQRNQLSPSLEIPMIWVYVSLAIPPLVGAFWVLWCWRFGTVEDNT